MRIGIPVLAILLLGLIWWFNRSSTSDVSRTSASGDQSPSLQAPVFENEFGHQATIDTSNLDSRFTRFSDGAVYLHQPVRRSRELHQEGTNFESDLEIVQSLLSSYRLVFKENPVGTDNEEIIAALAGENPKKTFLIDPKVLVNGQLLDRWGSPYKFHSVSSKVMEIRSFGPDRQLWTNDDLTLAGKN